jgi:hypothetical protein
MHWPPRNRRWIHGARNSSEHPFAVEVRALLKVLPAGRSHICYSAPQPTDRPAVDFDRVGRVGVYVFAELGIPRAADFYICGPATFMSGLVADLTGWGVAPDRLHTENFGSGPSMTPGVAAAPQRPRHPPKEAAGTGPLISFTRSNLAVRWGPAFHSLLELAEACDVPVRWSCRTGVCHNCETGLISGSVLYRPDPVEPPADGNLLIREIAIVTLTTSASDTGYLSWLDPAGRGFRQARNLDGPHIIAIPMPPDADRANTPLRRRSGRVTSIDEFQACARASFGNDNAGPRVCGLAAGGKRIRTAGPTCDRDAD